MKTRTFTKLSQGTRQFFKKVFSPSFSSPLFLYLNTDPVTESDETIVIPEREEKMELDEELVEEAIENSGIESQVIIHFILVGGPFGCRTRIWPTTYLFPNDSEHVSQLIRAEGITLFPEWTEIQEGQLFKFTLIFEGLPKNCKSFNVEEVIPQPGAMFVGFIQRNETDVYQINL